MATLLIVLALTPVLALVLTRIGRPWLPVQDFAITDLRVRDVGTANIPLVGAYSRFGWNHPGPWQFWLVAAMVGPFGFPSWGTLVGFAVVQGVGIVWLGRVAYRTGGRRRLLVVLAVLGVWYTATGPWIMLEPWNPHTAVPFFLVFVFQLWPSAPLTRQAVIGALLSGSLVIQAHIGYLPLVVTGLGVASIYLIRDRLQTTRSPLGWRSRTALVMTFALWMPPLFEEIRNFPDGNLSRLTSFFVLDQGAGRIVGFRQAAALVAGFFRIPPVWYGGFVVDPTSGALTPSSLRWILVPVLLTAGGVLAIRRTHNLTDFRLVVMFSTMLLAGWCSIARIRGNADPYLYYWLVPLTTLYTLVTCRAIVRALPARVEKVARPCLALVLAVAAVIPATHLAWSVSSSGPYTETLESDAALLLPELPRPSAPTIVRFAGPQLRGLQGAVINQLVREDKPIYVNEGLGYEWGTSRELSQGRADSVWYTVEEGQFASLLKQLPGANVLASTTPLTAAEEAELETLETKIAGELVSIGRPELVQAMSSDLFAFAAPPSLDAAAVNRIVELDKKIADSGKCRCSVVAFPASLAPPGTGDPYMPPISSMRTRRALGLAWI